MSYAPALPSLRYDDHLTSYLAEIRKFPVLSQQEEQHLAHKWAREGDIGAAHKLVTSHLRLVVRIAMGYRNYGLPLVELISEGNIGMMQAIKKFDPDRGFRLSTYAMWWIRAAIQEYILRSWSLVKIGTTSAQKKLFYNLRRLKQKLQGTSSHNLSAEHANQIAQTLDVSAEEVIDMNDRLYGGDQSLNAPLSEEGEGEWQDRLVDDNQDHETRMAEQQELQLRRSKLERAMSGLSTRERAIFTKRRLQDPAVTLEELSQEFRVSRERIRQIEARAFEKLQAAIRNNRPVEKTKRGRKPRLRTVSTA